MFRRTALMALFVVVSSFLAACDTAEERAQKHYEKGMSLLAEGEVDRALVEFRNVFKLNGQHKEARLAYAGVEEERGNVSGAYGQYLRLVEQYPDNLEGRRALSRLAATLNNWEEVERHVTVAKGLAPEDPVVQAVQAGLDYRTAKREADQNTMDLAVKVSETLLETNPNLAVSRHVVIDHLLRREAWTEVLPQIDAALEHDPDSLELYKLRLGVLERLGREDEITTQLKDLAQRYPEAPYHDVLVLRFRQQGKLEEAEAYLRDRIEPNQADPSPRQELVAFLREFVSAEAARSEIDAILLEATANRGLFRAIRAELDFQAGNREAAVNEMQDILGGLEPSEQTDRIKMSLSQMLIKTGNPVGARAQVEEVLEHDPSHVGALKMKASWLIEDDQPGDALVELRTALDQAPRDAFVMTLMARAHSRAGNRELSGEMLALAVEASGNAPDESLRYAKYLAHEEKLLSAEDVLQDALKVQPTNAKLLVELGVVYLQMQDWPRTQGVIDRLQSLEDELAQKFANELIARQLAGQNRSDELENFLGGLANGDSGLRAAATIVRLRLSQDDMAGALGYIDTLLSENPDNPTLKFIRAGVMAIDGQSDQAKAAYRELLELFPQQDRLWLALYNLHRSVGEIDVASEVLTEALIAAPRSGNLKLAAAGEAELGGEFEQAIAIYEDLYKANSNSRVVANNLASLISTHRDDDESLQRAAVIAQRLRDTTVPAFQDTYGWIAHRTGNTEEALPYLQNAAEALSSDPTVQYHLGVVLNALGRPSEALEQFRKAQALIEAGGPRPPFIETMQAEVDRLSGSQ